MKITKFLKDNTNETIRDITSFGNSLILIFIWLIALGFNKRIIPLIAGLIFIEVVGDSIKLIHYKERPNREKFNNLLEKINSGSFPSMHIARSAFVLLSLMLFLSFLQNILLAILLLFVCISRVYLKKHYFSDVVVGLILGATAMMLFYPYFI